MSVFSKLTNFPFLKMEPKDFIGEIWTKSCYTFIINQSHCVLFKHQFIFAFGNRRCKLQTATSMILPGGVVQIASDWNVPWLHLCVQNEPLNQSWTENSTWLGNASSEMTPVGNSIFYKFDPVNTSLQAAFFFVSDLNLTFVLYPYRTQTLTSVWVWKLVA